MKCASTYRISISINSRVGRTVTTHSSKNIKEYMSYKGIELNGIRYYEDSRCPSCSGERDTGGRLELKKRTRYFLKCKKCKYSILGEKTRNKREIYLMTKDKLVD